MCGANGSRECAPDDKLRETHHVRAASDGFRKLNPSYGLRLSPENALIRKLHLEDRERSGARQVVFEGDFPEMGIGDVEITAADRKAVGPGKFGGVADEDL